jgi:hypothetical protein
VKETLNRFLDNIVAARKSIWEESPEEISRLWLKKGARNQGATTVIRATRRLSQLAVFFHQIRSIANNEETDLNTLKIITASYLELFANYLGGEYFAMKNFASLLHQASAVLADVNSREDFFTLITELTLYTSRLDSWVFDFLIPWADFGETFELVAKKRLAITYKA